MNETKTKLNGKTVYTKLGKKINLTLKVSSFKQKKKFGIPIQALVVLFPTSRD